MTKPIGAIIISHNKPKFVCDAINSVLNQTFKEWEAIIIDSGILFNSGFFKQYSDIPNLRITLTDETPEMQKTLNMASWCSNKILNEGRLDTDLVCHLCDDDILYPIAFEAFVKARYHTAAQALYGSQDQFAYRDGEFVQVSERRADIIRGSCTPNKAPLDCKVDISQFCHTQSVLDIYRRYYNSKEYFAEAKEHYWHAEGIFMEKLGALTPFYPIDIKVSQNRRTPDSVNVTWCK